MSNTDFDYVFCPWCGTVWPTSECDIGWGGERDEEILICPRCGNDGLEECRIGNEVEEEDAADD